jgi:glycosyltransferase involved in cell wall biosynthesis
MGGVHRFLDSVLFNHSAEIRPVVLSFRDGPWLAELSRRGLSVHLIEGARIRKLPGVSRRVRRILGQERIDLVHSSYSWCHTLVYPAATWLGCRRVWFHHGPISGRRWQGVLNLVPTDLLLVNSEYMLERISRTFHRAKRLRVLHYGIDSGTLAPDPSARHRFRRRWGLADGEVAVGILGFIDTWKGQDVFLEAALRLKRAGRAPRMFVVGGPRDAWAAPHCLEHERRLRAFVAENELQDAVTFTGHVDIREGALDGLDIVVHASTIPEPFGMVVLEAMAKEKPVIASAEGGPREIVTPDADGLLVEPRCPDRLAHAIRDLCADPERRRELGRNARDTAATRFAPRRVAARLERFYHELGGARHR